MVTIKKKREAWVLKKIVPSLKKSKKYDAHFFDEISLKTRIISFGAAGYSDFTIHKDEERKKRYLLRHSARESWDDPLTPGSLSRWILWNQVSLKESIEDFKKRFGL